jgi:hypothetical protein
VCNAGCDGDTGAAMLRVSDNVADGHVVSMRWRSGIIGFIMRYLMPLLEGAI